MQRPEPTEDQLQAIADREAQRQAAWIATRFSPADCKLYMGGFSEGMQTLIARIRQWKNGEISGKGVN